MLGGDGEDMVRMETKGENGMKSLKEEKKAIGIGW